MVLKLFQFHSMCDSIFGQKSDKCYRLCPQSETTLVFFLKSLLQTFLNPVRLQISVLCVCSLSCQSGILFLQGDLMQRTTPSKLDDETLKFIRQKRPRLQCKGSVRSEVGSKLQQTERKPLETFSRLDNFLIQTSCPVSFFTRVDSIF